MSEPGDLDGRAFRDSSGEPPPDEQGDDWAFAPWDAQHRALADRMAMVNELLIHLVEWRGSVESGEYSRSLYNRLNEGVARLKAADEASESPRFARSIALIESALERLGLRLDGPSRN